MNVDPGGIDAVLDAQWTILVDGSLELLEEFGLRDDLLHTAFEDPKLFGKIPHGYSLAVSILAHDNEPKIPSSA